jgi:hypothetical protein
VFEFASPSLTRDSTVFDAGGSSPVRRYLTDRSAAW